MYWIDLFRLADIYRETYAATLKSWVPHGKKGDFAQKCGITREYLSCLCALDSQIDGSVPIHKRYPSPHTAKIIANALPAPKEIKRGLVEHMELAHANAVKAYYSARQTTNQQLVTERLSQLEQTHQQATFGKNLKEVQRAYRVVRDAAESLLRQIDPEKYPDSFAQTCLYYHDVQCILNRPDKALLYAKIAQLVLESVDDIETGYTKEQRDAFAVNAIRGEAIAYHNLRLDKKVPAILLERACHSSAYRNAKDFWEPLVKRDLINAMVEIPRFSIREVNKVARQIVSVCERKGDELTLLLVRESWLRAFIKRDKNEPAQRIFKEEIERLARLPYVGALHQALLFRSGAQLAWKMRDMETWKVYVTKSISLMHQAGLKHQLERVRFTYGSALDPVLRELVWDGTLACGIRELFVG